MAKSPQNDPIIFTDRMRLLTANVLTPISQQLVALGVHPDQVTIAGFLLVVIAGFFIAVGQHQLAALILIVALPFDALDGAVARAMQRKGRFGAVLDSSLDRYSDGVIFATLSYYFASIQRLDMMLVTQAALIGSLLVSYIRARGEGEAVVTKIGLFSRLERTIVILIMLAIPALLVIGTAVLAIGTNFTVVQRILFIRKSLASKGE